MASDSVAAIGVQEFSVDPHIWAACAGRSGVIPPVGTAVYYFPQGHAEQAFCLVEWGKCADDLSAFLCRMESIQFLANRSTDEVFAKVRLEAYGPDPAPLPAGGGAPPEVAGREEKLLSVSKVLTPSDANNGGAFSVPKICADRIFPPLDYSEKTPSQTLFVRDLQGNEIRFQHIYRGTPRRHLLTTHWATFVNTKKLIAGDSVVFIKDRSGQIFVGLRRAGRSGGIAPSAPSAAGESSTTGQHFSRNRRGWVAPQAVLEAARSALERRPFEVTYYPTVGLPEFVLRRDLVDGVFDASRFLGARVRSREGEDSTRMPSSLGTVTRAIRHRQPFLRSPWRTMEVSWDKQDGLQNGTMVSPWQVEVVPGPPVFVPSHLTKKPRTTENGGLGIPGAGRRPTPMPALGFLGLACTGMPAPAMDPSSSRQRVPPGDGIQGARQDLPSPAPSGFRPYRGRLSGTPDKIISPSPQNGEPSRGSAAIQNAGFQLTVQGSFVQLPAPVVRGDEEPLSPGTENHIREYGRFNFFLIDEMKQMEKNKEEGPLEVPSPEEGSKERTPDSDVDPDSGAYDPPRSERNED